MNMTVINAHLFVVSPITSASISAQILQHGSFLLNYTGTVRVEYLGLHVKRPIKGTKRASMPTAPTTIMPAL